MKEIWRPVPVEKYSKLYEVSNLGRVRSIARTLINVRGNSKKKSEPSVYTYHQQSHILKPYSITKSGTKYHLHCRFKSGEDGQSDDYFYADALVKKAFPYKKKRKLDK